MKVKVLAPFQVSHDGVIYRPGERADVPDHLARGWLAAGWVDAADAASRRVKTDLTAAPAITDPADKRGVSGSAGTPE